MTVSLMVDIETMGTASNAAIISIGAVPFSLDGDIRAKYIANFYVNIDRYSAGEHGTVCPDTMRWWDTQHLEVRDEAFSGVMSYSDAMREFAQYVDYNKFDTIWGNGANFDCVVIRSAMASVDVEPTWKFWQEMCVRTLLKLTHTTCPQAETAHHPISDCEAQIAGVIAAYGILQAGMDVQE